MTAVYRPVRSRCCCQSFAACTQLTRIAFVAAGNVLFRPVDSKLPLIRITTRQREALLGKRIVVTVDSWEPTSRYPNGHYVRTLGDVGDKEVETQVRLPRTAPHTYVPTVFTRGCVTCRRLSYWSTTSLRASFRPPSWLACHLRIGRSPKPTVEADGISDTCVSCPLTRPGARTLTMPCMCAGCRTATWRWACTSRM